MKAKPCDKFTAVAAAEIGKRYMARAAYSNYYEVLAVRRDKTHTYFKHKNGEAALPTDISKELFHLKPLV